MNESVKKTALIHIISVQTLSCNKPFLNSRSLPCINYTSSGNKRYVEDVQLIYEKRSAVKKRFVE